MKANPFAQYAQKRFKMNGSREKSIKHRIVSFYRSLYDVNWGKSFLVTLFEPPMTYAKGATYLIATMIISTGVYASVAPTSFARTSSVVKETVKASIDVIVAPLRNTNDVREDENEVFCDGERRDPEDCSENNEINNAQNESGDDSIISNDGDDNDTGDDMNDIREDENEVFCDGERRDPEDCVKRQAKKTIQYKTIQKSSNANDFDDSDERDDLDDTNDVREDENEVFCDGERRDPEDCAEREVKNDSEDREESNDVREDENKVFCDGERRDAEDCVKRVANQENQSTFSDNGEDDFDVEDEQEVEIEQEDEQEDEIEDEQEDEIEDEIEDEQEDD